VLGAGGVNIPAVDYVGQIFRPPSEANSLLLQVTVGCTHNRCTYCRMYLGTKFRTKPWEVVEADIEEAAAIGPAFERVFLCDGDALILSTPKLLRILSRLRERLPWVQRVGVYGDSRSVLRKSVAELVELRDAGLGIVYHGMESGDDEVLRRIQKGGTRAEAIATAERLREAGITHSVMVLLGVGGAELSEQHAAQSATCLSAMDPRYVGALTTTVVPGTRMFEQQQAGEFVLPGKFEMLRELRTIVAESEFTGCRFSSNHASNYVPIRSELPRDKAAIVAVLDQVLDRGDESELKPEWMRGL